jgi:hypothetical protein
VPLHTLSLPRLTSTTRHQTALLAAPGSSCSLPQAACAAAAAKPAASAHEYGAVKRGGRLWFSVRACVWKPCLAALCTSACVMTVPLHWSTLAPSSSLGPARAAPGASPRTHLPADAAAHAVRAAKRRVAPPSCLITDGKSDYVVNNSDMFQRETPLSSTSFLEHAFHDRPTYIPIIASYFAYISNPAQGRGLHVIRSRCGSVRSWQLCGSQLLSKHAWVRRKAQSEPSFFSLRAHVTDRNRHGGQQRPRCAS